MKVCVCKTCPMGGEPQPRENFYVASRHADGLQSWCKPCMKAARTRERKAHPEREKAYCHNSYERIKKDPERYAIHLDGSRQRKRRQLGITPDRWRVGVPVAGRGTGEPMVEVAPIREAVEWSGLTCAEIGGRCGIDESAIRRGLEQETMNAAKAGKILDAIGVLPADIGL